MFDGRSVGIVQNAPNSILDDADLAFGDFDPPAPLIFPFGRTPGCIDTVRRTRIPFPRSALEGARTLGINHVIVANHA